MSYQYDNYNCARNSVPNTVTSPITRKNTENSPVLNPNLELSQPEFDTFTRTTTEQSEVKDTETTPQAEQSDANPVTTTSSGQPVEQEVNFMGRKIKMQEAQTFQDGQQVFNDKEQVLIGRSEDGKTTYMQTTTLDDSGNPVSVVQDELGPNTTKSLSVKYNDDETYETKEETRDNQTGQETRTTNSYDKDNKLTYTSTTTSVTTDGVVEETRDSEDVKTGTKRHHEMLFDWNSGDTDSKTQVKDSSGNVTSESTYTKENGQSTQTHRKYQYDANGEQVPVYASETISGNGAYDSTTESLDENGEIHSQRDMVINGKRYTDAAEFERAAYGTE